METKTFDSPQSLIQHLSVAEDKLKTPSALGSWYWRAKMFYDPNICGCKKKNMSQNTIEDSYRNLIMLPPNEKDVARNIVGSSFTIVLNGATIGTI